MALVFAAQLINKTKVNVENKLEKKQGSEFDCNW